MTLKPFAAAALKLSVGGLVAAAAISAPTILSGQTRDGGGAPGGGAAAEPRWIPFVAGPGDDIVVPVSVDGVGVGGLLETGTPAVTIDSRLASDLKLRLAPAPSLTGLSGKVAVQRSVVRSLKVGLFDGRDIGVEVADFSRVPPETGVAFSIILGARFFTWAALQVDFDHSVLRFLPTGAATGGVATAEARLDPETKKLMTSIEINGVRIDRVELSTGQPSALRLSPRIWSRVRPENGRVTDIASADLTGIAVAPYAILPELKIAGLSVRGVTTIIDPDQGGVLALDDANAMIGLDLLRRFNLVLDAAAGKLMLANRVTNDPPEPKSTAGVQGSYGADGLRIIHVMSGSPAQAAGLKDGDRICAVDRAPIDASWATSEKRNWSTGPVGRRVELTLCGGAAKALTLAEFY